MPSPRLPSLTHICTLATSSGKAPPGKSDPQDGKKFRRLWIPRKNERPHCLEHGRFCISSRPVAGESRAQHTTGPRHPPRRNIPLMPRSRNREFVAHFFKKNSKAEFPLIWGRKETPASREAHSGLGSPTALFPTPLSPGWFPGP